MALPKQPVIVEKYVWDKVKRDLVYHTDCAIATLEYDGSLSTTSKRRRQRYMAIVIGMLDTCHALEVPELEQLKTRYKNCLTQEEMNEGSSHYR